MASLLYNPDGTLKQQFSGNGTVTSITAGTGLSGGTITSSGTISLPNVGTAGTYTLPVCTTDGQGRVSAATSSLSTPPVIGEHVVGSGDTPDFLTSRYTGCMVFFDSTTMPDTADYYYAIDTTHLVTQGDVLTPHSRVFGEITHSAITADNVSIAQIAGATATNNVITFVCGYIEIGGAGFLGGLGISTSVDASLLGGQTSAPIAFPQTSGVIPAGVVSAYPAVRFENNLETGGGAAVSARVVLPMRIN